MPFPQPSEITGAIIAWRKTSAGVTGPMRLSELARHAMALWQALPQSDAETVSCRKGCGACCRQVVPLSPSETFHVEELIAGASAARRRKLNLRFRIVSRRLKRETMDRLPLFHYAPEYFRLGLPCPFLEEESCSIHADRPLVCREHLAVSPAEHCADFPGAFVRLLPQPVSVREALAELTAECCGAGQVTVPLSRGPDWAADNRELSERTWDGAWLLDRLADICLRNFGEEYAITIRQPIGD
jgi:Fe-S-cluster containining protein